MAGGTLAETLALVEEFGARAGGAVVRGCGAAGAVAITGGAVVEQVGQQRAWAAGKAVT